MGTCGRSDGRSDDNDPMEQGDKVPEFPGMDSKDVLSSTIRIIQSNGEISNEEDGREGNDAARKRTEESILRGTQTKSKDLLNSVQDVNNPEDQAVETLEVVPESALDTSICQGLNRLRSFREKKMEEERMRIREILKERGTNGPTTRSQAEEITQLHHTRNKFDPFQHPNTPTRPHPDMEEEPPQDGNKQRNNDAGEDQVELYVVESDFSFSNPETASIPAVEKEGSGRRGGRMSSWADDSNTSAYSSILDVEGKRKRKRNKRSRRCKRRTEADTSTNSEIRGKNDYSLYLSLIHI